MTKAADKPLSEEIKCAVSRLEGVAIRTPLLENKRLNTILGGRLLLKAECLQHTGSFKYRGAFNCITNLSKTDLAAGVICYSSGNHAQAVAATAQTLGIDAVVVVPSTAPQVKLDAANDYGAEVIVHEGTRSRMESFVKDLASRTGRFLVKPFDDPQIIAGQATVGVEITEQLAERNVKACSILVPCSGGGLSSGIVLAVAQRMPGTTVHPVEPLGFDDTARSLKSGKLLSNVQESTSICDALLVPTPGKLTFEINRTRLGVGYVVSDDAVRDAMRCAFKDFKVILEPGGAAALAAVLSKQVKVKDRVIVVIGSGGNVDPVMFSRIIEKDQAGPTQP